MPEPSMPAYKVPAHFINKAIFLDRDGVLNKEIGDYVYRLEDFVIPNGVPEALARLKQAGYFLIVVTNQGGIDKGIYTAAQVEYLHSILQEQVGGCIDHFYYSPHANVISRSILSKPQSGMLERGVHRFLIDPTKSWIVGDAGRDLEAGHAIGVRGILVPTLKEQEYPLASYIARDIADAADHILANPL